MPTIKFNIDASTDLILSAENTLHSFLLARWQKRQTPECMLCRNAGSIVYNRLNEWRSNEGSGKTTISLEVMSDDSHETEAFEDDYRVW